MARRVIVEIRVPRGAKDQEVFKMAKVPWFRIDRNYQPVPITPGEDIVKSLQDSDEEVMLIRGEVEEDKEEELRSMPKVVKIWSDARIEPF